MSQRMNRYLHRPEVQRISFHHADASIRAEAAKVLRAMDAPIPPNEDILAHGLGVTHSATDVIARANRYDAQVRFEAEQAAGAATEGR